MTYDAMHSHPRASQQGATALCGSTALRAGGTPSAGSARTGRPGCRATATQGSQFDGFMRAGEIADMLQANLRFLAPVRPGGVITGMVQGMSPAATSRSPS